MSQTSQQNEQANVVIPKGKDTKGRKYKERLQRYAKNLRREAGTKRPRD